MCVTLVNVCPLTLSSANSPLLQELLLSNLGDVVAHLRNRYDVEYFYCWHGLSGYWGGVSLEVINPPPPPLPPLPASYFPHATARKQRCKSFVTGIGAGITFFMYSCNCQHHGADRCFSFLLYQVCSGFVWVYWVYCLARTTPPPPFSPPGGTRNAPSPLLRTPRPWVGAFHLMLFVTSLANNTQRL